MKKILFLCLTVFLVSTCKKEATPEPETPVAVDDSDKTAPVITLKGNAKDTISLGGPYTDAGATGIDNKDGDISAFIVTSGTVNVNLTGDNQLEYNLRDAAGNLATKVIRYIHVRNTAAFLAGNYNVTCSTKTINPGVEPEVTGNTTHTANITMSNSINNKFVISQLNIGPIFVNPFTTLNGNSIGVSYNNSSYPLTSGSGTLSASKTSFTISTVSGNYFTPNKTLYCISVFTKQ